MTKQEKKFEYGYRDLAEQSGWDTMRVRTDVSSRGLQPDRIEEVAVWLAANGSPEIRQLMAEALMPVIFEGIQDFVREHLLAGILREDHNRRQLRGSRISKTKRRSEQND